MIFLLSDMETFFSAKGLLLIDAVAVALLLISIHGQYKVLFSPLGRINRLTFWEGLVAWALINVLILIGGVAHFSFPFEEQLAQSGDTDHAMYHGFVMTFTLVCSLTSLWILAALCAKRWHDLNFSGLLATLNILPILMISAVWWVFNSSISPTMIRHLAYDQRYSPFDLWREVFPLPAGFPSITNWSWSAVLSCCLVIALGVYLGFAKGDAGGNIYGKSAA